MAKKFRMELDDAWLASVPNMEAYVERHGAYSIRPRFNEDEDVVAYSVFRDATRLHSFSTLSLSRVWLRKQIAADKRQPAPLTRTERFTGSYADSFAA